MRIEIRLIEEVKDKEFGIQIFNKTTETEVAMLEVSKRGENYLLEGVPEGNYKTTTFNIPHKILASGRAINYQDPITAANQAELFAKMIAKKELEKNKTGGIISFKQ